MMRFYIVLSTVCLSICLNLGNVASAQAATKLVPADGARGGSYQPSEVEEGDRFGNAVAFDTWVVGGAPWDDEVIGGVLQVNSGSAYVRPFWG